MPLRFLIRYTQEQYGFVPDAFTPAMVRSAKQAYMQCKGE